MTTAAETGRDATWRERSATFAVFLALGLGVGAWAAAVPGIKQSLALSDRDLSIALLTLALGSVLSTIATGVIAPRFGTGRSTGTAAFAAMLTFLLPVLAQSLVQLAACTFVLGLANGALDISMNGHASDIERRWLSPIMSSFHAAFSVGGLAGSVIGGLVASAGWSVAAQLWTPIGLAILLVSAAAPGLGLGAPARRVRGTGLAWPERAALGLCVMAMACFLIEGAIADWSGVYLLTVAHASEGAAASGYAAFSTTMVVGRILGDRLVRVLGPRRVVLFGGLLAAAGMALVLGWLEPVATSLGFALVGLGVANVIPVMFSTAGRFGSSPSAGVAMVATFGYAGFLGGPPIIGALATWAGLHAALVLLLAAALLVAVGSLGVDRSRSG